jgi:hypothetical protein
MARILMQIANRQNPDSVAGRAAHLRFRRRGILNDGSRNRLLIPLRPIERVVRF